MLDTMPPRKAAMKPEDFRALLDRAGLKPTGAEAAQRIGVHRNTVRRWASGESTISAASAALIREKLGGK